ncbi:DapH/DapD/GlmU-related protein [Exiguobacterium acetylicum]|uniref:DapH/DapD/GlmU-related protein n=1 Tax=Exiguobacterium acetylicum TaxID=41170 RepID=UPI00244E0F32|nr:DapH/DapD/GlmU-related protein [Exiguobacterium acetylicum]
MNNHYSIGENIKNVMSFLYTKVFFSKARLIRIPFYLRGKSSFKYGKGFTTGYGCRIETFNINSKNDYKIILGENCKMGDRVHIASGNSVIIGDNCLLASNIYISDISHGYYEGKGASKPNSIPDERPLISRPIRIGNNVWIGENVSILPGVNIGDGCIVGANSVVTKSVSKNCIIAGVPANVIKIYNENNEKWEKQ